MNLRCGAPLVLLAVFPLALQAAPPCRDIACDDEQGADARAADDAESVDAASAETAATRDETKSFNVSGLVPLRELNRRPYQSFWLGTLRLHSYELGIAASNLNLSGEVDAVVGNGGSSTAIVEKVEGTLLFAGLSAGYYQPLFGYSPEFSLGLLGQLQAQIGASYSGSSSSALNDQMEGKVGTLLRLPLIAVARFGDHASRYADFPISLGAGVGLELVSFSTGTPVVDAGSYLAPVIRIELAWRAFCVAYEAAIAQRDNFSSATESPRLRYNSQTFSLTFAFKPNADD